MAIKKIIVLVLIIVAAGVAIYFGWGKLMGVIKPVPQPSPSPAGPILPQFQNLNLISKEKALDYWFLGNEIFYVTPEGKIIKISGQNQEEVIQNITLESLNSLTITPDGQKIAFSFDKPEKFRIFSVADNLWQPLEESIVKFSWSPTTSTQIVYLKKNGNLYNLATYNFTSKKENLIATLASQDINVFWLAPEKILVWEKPSYYKPASLLSFNPKTKKVEVLINEQPGLMLNWSTNKEMALISKSGHSIEPVLSLVNKKFETIAALPFIALPSKCAFSEDSKLIACAVPQPQEIRKKWRFPDDWLSQGINLPEAFYLTGLTEGSTTLPEQIIPSSVVNTGSVKIHQGEIFFINHFDQKLYSIKVSQ